MIPAKTQHFQAGRMKATVRVHAVDHSPMLTAPGTVVDVLVESVIAHPTMPEGLVPLLLEIPAKSAFEV